MPEHTDGVWLTAFTPEIPRQELPMEKKEKVIHAEPTKQSPPKKNLYIYDEYFLKKIK